MQNKKCAKTRAEYDTGLRKQLDLSRVGSVGLSLEFYRNIFSYHLNLRCSLTHLISIFNLEPCERFDSFSNAPVFSSELKSVYFQT